MPGADRPTRARVWALSAAGGIAYWRAETDATRAPVPGPVRSRDRDRRRPRDRRCLLQPGLGPVRRRRPVRVARPCARGQAPVRGARRRADVNRIDWGLANLPIVDRRRPGPAIRRTPPDPRAGRGARTTRPYVALAAAALAWVVVHARRRRVAGQWTVRAMLAELRAPRRRRAARSAFRSARSSPSRLGRPGRPR